MGPASEIVQRFDQFIITPAIAIVFTAGFFLFIWGLVQFIWSLDEGSHEDGKQHMIWGIVGMLIMVSVYGIIQLLDSTFNLDINNPDIRRAEDIQSNVFR